jgi:hypothetical protein
MIDPIAGAELLAARIANAQKNARAFNDAADPYFAWVSDTSECLVRIFGAEDPKVERFKSRFPGKAALPMIGGLHLRHRFCTWKVLLISYKQRQKFALEMLGSLKYQSMKIQKRFSLSTVIMRPSKIKPRGSSSELGSR